MIKVNEVHENKYKTTLFCSTDDDTQSVKVTVTNKRSVGKEDRVSEHRQNEKSQHSYTIISLYSYIRKPKRNEVGSIALSTCKHIFLSILKCKSILKIAIMYILYSSYFNDIVYDTHFITCFII